MEKKFGTFKTVDELNRAAEAQKAEGDREALYAMAEENGLDKESVDDFMEDDVKFVYPLEAACGKLDMEMKEIRTDEIISDWIDYIRQCCVDVEGFSEKVFDPDKTLKGCLAYLLKWSFDNMYEIDKEICKAAGCACLTVKVGEPGMRTAKRLIREYYEGVQAHEGI